MHILPGFERKWMFNEIRYPKLSQRKKEYSKIITLLVTREYTVKNILVKLWAKSGSKNSNHYQVKKKK